MITENQKADFYRGFIATLFWSSVDDDGEPLDDGNYELAPITKQLLRDYCDVWCDANANDLKSYAMSRGAGFVYMQAGHDFALTANGHGTGFWDRGLGELGERLSRASKADYSKTPKGYDVTIRTYKQGISTIFDGWQWVNPKERTHTNRGKGIATGFSSRIVAIMGAWQHSGQTPPESMGPLFETYTGDDGLIYVSGFEK